jgi:hypothetical protein
MYEAGYFAVLCPILQPIALELTKCIPKLCAQNAYRWTEFDSSSVGYNTFYANRTAYIVRVTTLACYPPIEITPYTTRSVTLHKLVFPSKLFESQVPHLNATTRGQVKKVVTGHQFSTALTLDGRVKSWGTAIENLNQQISIRTGTYALGIYSTNASRGSSAGEMGDNLETVAWNVIDISANERVASALFKDGRVAVWSCAAPGDGQYPQNNERPYCPPSSLANPFGGSYYRQLNPRTIITNFINQNPDRIWMGNSITCVRIQGQAYCWGTKGKRRTNTHSFSHIYIYNYKLTLYFFFFSL